MASGIESILIITSRDKASIENHFDISFELESVLKERGKQRELEQVRAISELANITYIRQKQALGLGHAIYQAKEFVGVLEANGFGADAFFCRVDTTAHGTHYETQSCEDATETVFQSTVAFIETYMTS